MYIYILYIIRVWQCLSRSLSLSVLCLFWNRYYIHYFCFFSSHTLSCLLFFHLCFCICIYIVIQNGSVPEQLLEFFAKFPQVKNKGTGWRDASRPPPSNKGGKNRPSGPQGKGRPNQQGGRGNRNKHGDRRKAIITLIALVTLVF